MACKQDVGQEGHHDDGDGDAKRKNIHRRNVVNFFFTNFPPEWNKDSLHELFADVGDIANVYVARKMSKEGKRFGFARFFRDGNLQSLANRLNRVKIGSFKLRANVAKFEKSVAKYNEGCKKDGWVFDIPSKSDKSPARNPSSAPDLSTAENTYGESVVIHSLFELQSLLGSSFDVSICKVEFLGGSKFSLEFESKQEGHDLTRIDSKSTVEADIDINSGSNLIDGDFLGTSEELSKPNNTDCKVTLIEDSMEKSETEKTEAVDCSTFPAQGIHGEILNSKSKFVDPCAKDDVQLDDNHCKDRAKDKTSLSHGEKVVTVIDDFRKKKGVRKPRLLILLLFPPKVSTEIF